MTREEQTKVDDLYSKAIKWVDEGIRLWSNEEEIKFFANADEASEKVEIFRFVKKCVETAYPILKGEERILMGEANRQPVGIADQLTREGADPLARAEGLLLAQMQQLQATTAEILSGESWRFELETTDDKAQRPVKGMLRMISTVDKAQQLTKGMCRLSMELRLLQHLKREPVIDGGVRSHIHPQTLQEAVEKHKRLREARGVQRT